MPKKKANIQSEKQRVELPSGQIVEFFFELHQTYAINLNDGRVEFWQEAYLQADGWAKYSPATQSLSGSYVSKDQVPDERIQILERSLAQAEGAANKARQSNLALQQQLKRHNDLRPKLDAYLQKAVGKTYDEVARALTHNVDLLDSSPVDLAGEADEAANEYELAMLSIQELPGVPQSKLDAVVMRLRERYRTLAALKVATAAELQELQGVGPAIANKVVDLLAADLVELETSLASGTTEEEVEQELDNTIQDLLASAEASAAGGE